MAERVTCVSVITERERRGRDRERVESFCREFFSNVTWLVGVSIWVQPNGSARLACKMGWVNIFGLDLFGLGLFKPVKKGQKWIGSKSGGGWLVDPFLFLFFLIK